MLLAAVFSYIILIKYFWIVSNMFKRFLLIVLLTGALGLPLQAAETIYGPIGRQDTLWNLAESMRPSKDVTTQQVMMALYKKNPHAFTVNNISSLRKNAYMLAPSEAETKQIGRKTAIQMVRRHNVRWKKRRYVRTNAPVPAMLKKKLAERDADAAEKTTATEAATTQPQQATTSTVVAASTPTATVKAADEATSASAGSDVAIQEQLRLVQEELEQTKTENKRLNSELAALKQEQKQTSTQSEANQEIQVQLDALRHELDELRTILTQKDNHIKVLQASLKDASKAIKSQHADNMRLYNKLKELSPESLAAIGRAANSSAEGNSNTQGKPVKPQIELAAVTIDKPIKASAPEEVDDSGIAKVWADETPENTSRGLQTGLANQPTNAVRQDNSVTLSQILNTQNPAPDAAPIKKFGFSLSNDRSAPVSPIAWAAVLISFVFILFLIVRALLMQNELRRLERG